VRVRRSEEDIMIDDASQGLGCICGVLVWLSTGRHMS